MRKLLLLAMLLSVPAQAEDASSPAKTPTVDELQKEVAYLNLALQDATAQRDSYRSQLDNLEIKIDAERKAEVVAHQRQPQS